MAENNAMNVRIVDGDDCCPQAMCVKVCNLVQEVRKTGASRKLIPSEKAVSDALKGRQELLVAGAAEGILGPSASTGLAQVLTAPSAGVSIVDAIKGRTLVWNQLVDDDTETVTVPSGHKYFALIGGVSSVATSDGTALSVTGGTDNVVDLTQMFSAGNEPATVAEFTALFPNFPYAFNAGTLLPFKGKALKVTGFNQWDEQYYETEQIIASNGQSIVDNSNYITLGSFSNPIPVVQGKTYVVSMAGSVVGVYYIFLDHNKNSICARAYGASISIPDGAFFIVVSVGGYTGTTYNHNICINISNPSLNGTYKPYTETLVNIDAIGKSAKDSGGNAIVPFPEGMNGTPTAYDVATKVGGSKWFGAINLGDFDYFPGGATNLFAAVIPGLGPAASTSTTFNALTNSNKYVIGIQSQWQNVDYQISRNNNAASILVKNKDITSAEQLKADLNGVYLVYQFDTPVPFTWDEPFTLAFTAEEGGTIWLQPEGVDEAGVPVSAPLNADIAYTVPAGQVINATTLDNLLTALKTAGVISAYTMTPDGSGNYTFTITV